jgi:hypothetical protein
MCAAYGLLVLVTALGAILPPARALPDYALLACWLPFAAHELGSAVTASNWASYAASGSNWADWINYALLAFVSVPQSAALAAESVRCAYAALLVLMGFKVLFYVRAYTTLVATILQAFCDMGAFALIVLLILISFATASIALIPPDANGSRVPPSLAGFSLAEVEGAGFSVAAANAAFLPQFALMFGSFDQADFAIDGAISPSAIARASLFYAFSGLVTIVLLNLLITILSNSYDLSSERRRAELMRMRAQLIVEYHGLLPTLLKPRGRYVHVLASSAHLAETRADFEIESAGSEDEWANRLSALKHQIGAVRRESAAAASRLEARVDKIGGQVAVSNGQLASALAALQAIIAQTQATEQMRLADQLNAAHSRAAAAPPTALDATAPGGGAAPLSRGGVVMRRLVMARVPGRGLGRPSPPPPPLAPVAAWGGSTIEE